MMVEEKDKRRWLDKERYTRDTVTVEEHSMRTMTDDGGKRGLIEQREIRGDMSKNRGATEIRDVMFMNSVTCKLKMENLRTQLSQNQNLVLLIF